MILGYPHFRKPPSLVFHLVDVLPACRFHATQGYVKSQNFPKPTTLSYHLPRNGTFRTWTCGIIAAESDRLVFFNWTISGSMCFCIAFCDTEKRLKTSQKLLAPEKVFCFQMFSDKLINSPKNIDPVLRPREARNRPSHLWKNKNKNRILRWKLFPVDQWIDWGGKILTGNNGLHMILPWNIGVSCRFSHPTEVDEPVDRKHLGKW